MFLMVTCNCSPKQNCFQLCVLPSGLLTWV
jgi:hypothetical protein